MDKLLNYITNSVRGGRPLVPPRTPWPAAAGGCPRRRCGRACAASATWRAAAARQSPPPARTPSRPRPEESTLVYGLSYNAPYNPPHNKRILYEEEERYRAGRGEGAAVIGGTVAGGVVAAAGGTGGGEAGMEVPPGVVGLLLGLQQQLALRPRQAGLDLRTVLPSAAELLYNKALHTTSIQ